MKIPRIYCPGDYQVGEMVVLPPSAAQHVGVVLRMSIGESLVLFPGDRRECLAQITSAEKKRVCVRILEEQRVDRESPRCIHLAQAISKGDRMDVVIQKAVELGVTSIAPLLTSRCVVRLPEDRWSKKQLQWQAIAIAACEQSGRTMIPTVHQPMSLGTYLMLNQASIRLTLSPTAHVSWRELTFPPGDISILIGPEGGLTDDELFEATKAGFQGISLGPRILRTETAAITAMSLLQAIAGDL